MTYHSSVGHAEEWEYLEMLSQVRRVMGDPVVVVPPLTTTGTSVDDYSGNARTLTATESVAGWLDHSTRGYMYVLDGTADYMYRADDAGLTFGNGSSDSAFSVMVVMYPTSVASYNVLVSKADVTLYKEWALIKNEDDILFAVYDDVEGSQLARSKTSVFSADTWYSVIATYDGSGASTGINVYVDGVKVDDTDSSSGSYTAMGDTAAKFVVGARMNNDVADSFFPGKIGMVCVTAGEISSVGAGNLDKIVKGFYGV